MFRYELYYYYYYVFSVNYDHTSQHSKSHYNIIVMLRIYILSLGTWTIPPIQSNAKWLLSGREMYILSNWMARVILYTPCFDLLLLINMHSDKINYMHTYIYSSYINME